MSSRPPEFVLDPGNPFYDGLVFASLGFSAGCGTAFDSSPYGNHGTLVGLVPSDDWIFNPYLGRFCLYHNGTGDYVSLPASVGNVAPTTGDCTLSAWLYWTGAGVDVAFGKYTDVSPFSGWWIGSNSGTASYAMNGVTATNGTVGAAWTHLVGIKVANVLTLYRNGVPGSPATVTGTGSFANLPCSIGRFGDFTSYDWAGYTSDVLWWPDRALSQPEIQQLADPSNVLLSGLILPPRRRLWTVGFVAAAGGSSISETSTAALSDSLTAVLKTAAIAADTTALSDSATAVLIATASVSDTVALSDSAIASSGLSLIESDTVALSDAASGALIAAAVLSDTAALSDSATAALTASCIATDTASLSDAAIAAMLAASSLSDTTSLSDSAATVLVATASAADTAALSDSAILALLATASVSDTTSLSDSVTTLLVIPGEVNQSDNLALSDIVTVALKATALASDTAALSDAATAVLVAVASVSDTLAMSDSATASTGLAAIASNTLTLSDSATTALTATGIAADTAAFSDLLETLLTTPLMDADESDTVSLTDAVTAVLTAAASVSDNLALSDSAEAEVSTLLSTIGVFTITNIRETRSASSGDDAQTLADLVGTMIYDIQNGTFNGADYSFSGLLEDRSFDQDDTNAYELLCVAATLCDDNPTDSPFQAHGYTVLNPVLAYAMDCQDTELETVAKILAALISWKRWGYLRPASVTGGRMGAASVTGGRMGAASVTGGR